MLKLVVDNKPKNDERSVTFCDGVPEDIQEKVEFFTNFFLPTENFVLIVEHEAVDNKDYAAKMEQAIYGKEVFYTLTITDLFLDYEDFSQSEEIAHEITHLKQYVRGELVDVTGGVEWRGNLYEYPFCSEEFDPVDITSPWEMEAYACGRALALAWQEREDERWIDWYEETKGTW